MEGKGKLNGVWDANRILQEYLRFSDIRGRIKKIDLSDNSPYGIKLRRFAAAMKAYGRDMEELIELEDMISMSCSSEKLDQFRKLLKQLLDNKYLKDQVDDAKFIRYDSDIYSLFGALLKYRKSLYEVETVWSGLIECSFSVSMICQATKGLYAKHIKVVSDIIDQMLILLMGDDFDRSFTEEDLLQYGYPDVTDEELEDLIIDNF